VKEGEPALIALVRHFTHGETIQIKAEGGAWIKRKLEVKHFSRPQEEGVARCHLLFISNSEETRLADVLKAVERCNALTVGEMDRFTERGGIINCVEKRQVSGTAIIRFEINHLAAKKRNLKLDSDLLALDWRVK
jgi:hypothetical protein